MPRSATVNQELRERSRERILTAALETFAAKGYEAASISDITAAAGVSRGLVAYYFGTKEQLAAELLDRWLDGIAALLTLQAPPTNASPPSSTPPCWPPPPRSRSSAWPSP